MTHCKMAGMTPKSCFHRGDIAACLGGLSFGSDAARIEA